MLPRCSVEGMNECGECDVNTVLGVNGEAGVLGQGGGMGVVVMLDKKTSKCTRDNEKEA